MAKGAVKKGAVKSVVDFFRGRRETIGKAQILSILPHRGDKLFLDSVEIVGDKRITGQVSVRRGHCIGHEILKDRLLFKGVDFTEMAAQILGVVWGIKHPDFLDMVGLLKDSGGFKISRPVFVGDYLEIDIDPKDIIERIRKGPEREKMFILLTLKRAVARVGKEERAEINSIRIVIVDPKKVDPNRLS